MTSSLVRLTREVRFQLPLEMPAPDQPAWNSWAGWPRVSALAPFVRVQCTVAAPVAHPTGYVADVKTIDGIVREASLSVLVAGLAQGSDLAGLTGKLFAKLQRGFSHPLRLERIRLVPTPYQSFTATSDEAAMTILTHQFEFSAAHRLHCPQMTDAENLEVFGKCNSPNGHGHNYVLDVSVRCADGVTPVLSELEATVVEHAVSRLDHKHLNVDVPEFFELNPTVENIAQVVWELLAPHLPHLQRVRVYETPKTWADVGSDM